MALGIGGCVCARVHATTVPFRFPCGRRCRFECAASAGRQGKTRTAARTLMEQAGDMDACDALRSRAPFCRTVCPRAIADVAALPATR
jgi:hypothetical protein